MQIYSTLIILIFFTLHLTAQDNFTPDEYMRLAENYKKVSKPDSAILYFEKAAALFQTTNNYESQVNALNQIGIILTRQDKYEISKKYLDQALLLGQSKLDSGSLFLATTYISLGVLHAAEENYKESLVFHNKALAIRLSKLGENHSDVATSYGNIGNVYFRSKDYSQAIEAHLMAMNIREKLFGPESPEITQSYTNLGNAYKEQKDYTTSLSFYLKALKNKIKLRGLKHKELIPCYNNLKDVYYLMGDMEQGDFNKQKAEEILNNTER
jgi:tetratricopeptide (TPR) repeat protein